MCRSLNHCNNSLIFLCTESSFCESLFGSSLLRFKLIACEEREGGADCIRDVGLEDVMRCHDVTSWLMWLDSGDSMFFMHFSWMRDKLCLNVTDADFL